MTADLPPALLSLLRDLSDPGKWRRIRMYPGNEILKVCDAPDVKQRASDILREMEGDDGQSNPN